MIEENPLQIFTLDRLDFIFRRPWVITFSFLMIFNAVQAYSVAMPMMYSTKAVLLFESALGTTTKTGVINEKKIAAEKILTGGNVEKTLEEVLKNKSAAEKKDLYEPLKSALMNAKSGIQFKWEDKGVGYALSISFSYPDASDCYKTVKATMNMIIAESEQKFTREMEANLLFLRNQTKFYQDKLEDISAKSEEIKQQLTNRYSELSAVDKETLSKLVAIKDVPERPVVQQAVAMDDDNFTKLKQTLADFKSTRKKLQTSLDDGTFLVQSILTNMEDEKASLEEYKKWAASKTMEIEALLSRGYKEAHPMVKQLRDEIKRAQELRLSRFAGAGPDGGATAGYEEARQRIVAQIKELDMKISLIVNNIKNIEQTSAPVENRDERPVGSGEPVKELISRLSSLGSEKTINETYYSDMRKNLGLAELKYRTENEAAGFKISVVQAPELPTKPDASKRQKDILRGFILAPLIALGIGYIAYQLSGAVHSDRELEELLGIPVIATIDTITTKADLEAKRLRFKYALIAVIVAMILTRVIILVLV